MPDSIALVGREQELQQIHQCIGEWGTRQLVFIYGEGGVGKTRLVEEIQRYYSVVEKRPLLVTDIIDFDDRTLHVIENVEGQLMHNLGPQASRDYERHVFDLHRMQLAGVSYEEQEEQRRQVRRCLLINFAEVSAERRVVVFFDGVEKLEVSNAWDQLADLMLRTHNTVFILAGRNAKQLGERFTSTHPDLAGASQLIELRSLEEEPSREYLARKQAQLSITISPTIADRILLLTGGKPILIDLAVEWLARSVSLDWLTTEEGWARTLAQTQDSKQQQEFQARWVEQIGQIRSRTDRLILLMSRVYPVSIDMIAQSLGVSEDVAGQLLRQAKTYTFVKSYRDRRPNQGESWSDLQGERIYLHDEIRRMIWDFVWPDIDPDGVRRKLDSQFAVSYLTPRSETLAERIERYTDLEEIGRKSGEHDKEFEAFISHQFLDQELWAVRRQLLFHSMFVDAGSGLELFAKLFDQATRDYQYSLREVLLEQMERYTKLAARETYLKRLSPEHSYEVEIRRAKFLLDSARYEEADVLLRKMLARANPRPDQHVDMHIQLANVVLRMARYRESIDLFEKAVAISESYDLPKWLVKAENGLGWAYRHTANREEAQKHYSRALEIAKELDLKHEQALLYSNLGFIYAYLPSERHKAFSHCRASLSLWEELDDKRGKGRANSTLGCVNFMAGQFDEALLCFQQALEIFEPVGDREWLSTVYSWRAAVYMSTRHLDLAKEDLQRSLRIDVAKDRPMNLARLGGLYMMMPSHLDLAQQAIDECHSLAQEAIDECHSLAVKQGNVLYQLISIRDLARLARHKKEFSRLETLESLLHTYLQEWPDPQDRRALGMLYLNLGSLALGQAKVDKAIGYYKQGLQPLTELDRYGRDTIDVHIERLEKVFVSELGIGPAIIRTIGCALQEFWHEKGFDNAHPDVSMRYNRWANWNGV